MSFKKFIVPFFVIFLIAFISSAPPITSVALNSRNGFQIAPNLFNSVKLNSSLTFHVHIFNASNGLEYTGTSNLCILHLYNEFNTGEQVYTNNSPIIDDDDYEFNIPRSTFSEKGEYSYKIWCNNSVHQIGGYYEKSFYVTGSGGSPANDPMTIFIYILFIISTIGLFTTFFLTIAKLVTTRETIFGVLITWSFLILNIIVNYLGKEYLLRTLVEDISGLFIIITIWSNGVLPVISLIITMFIVGTKKKKNLSVEEITGGGRILKYG